MEYKFSIATIAFNKRYESCFKGLIRKIKSLEPNIEIIVGVNGNYNEDFDQEFRKDILQFLSQYNNVYPIFFPSFRGWAKINNTMFLHSTKDDILFVSDDVEITNDNILNEVESRINGTTMMINNSFSHYICNRVELDSFGWFDERLVGFGEEDGDLIYRYLEAGRQIQSVWINGVRDAGSQVASSYEKGVGKYTKFNRDWIFTNKYVPDPNGFLGIFGFPHKRIGENIQQYPTEKFYWKHKHSL